MEIIKINDIDKFGNGDYPKIVDGKILHININRDCNWVLYYKGELYRLIINSKKHQIARWENIQEFVKSNDFKSLIENGYVPKLELTDLKLEGFEDGDIYKVEKVFYSCRNFLTLNKLLNCLKLLCKIHILLKNNNSLYHITDPHFDNFGFKYYNPLYIDIGSFSIKSKTCENYVNEIITTIFNERIENNLLKRDCKKPFLSGNWEQFLQTLENFQYNLNKGEWGNYSNSGQLEYESNIVLNWIKNINIKSIIDIGCCKGEFAKVFSDNGYSVIAIDNEEFVLDELYKNSKNTKIDCLLLDVINSNPPFYDWKSNVKSDVIFCSSIIHHLYRKGLNFKAQEELWNKIGKKYIIIEYIDNTDEFVKAWKEKGLPIYNDYNIQNFLDSFKNNWEFLDKKQNGKYTNRFWYFFKKRNMEL